MLLPLDLRSTSNQSGNCGQILATLHLYYILQLYEFAFRSFTHTPIRLVDAGVSRLCVISYNTAIILSLEPELARQLPPNACHRILHLAVFDCCTLSERLAVRATLGPVHQKAFQPTVHQVWTVDCCHSLCSVGRILQKEM